MAQKYNHLDDCVTFNPGFDTGVLLCLESETQQNGVKTSFRWSTPRELLGYMLDRSEKAYRNLQTNESLSILDEISRLKELASEGGESEAPDIDLVESATRISESVGIRVLSFRSFYDACRTVSFLDSPFDKFGSGRKVCYARMTDYEKTAITSMAVSIHDTLFSDENLIASFAKFSEGDWKRSRVVRCQNGREETATFADIIQRNENNPEDLLEVRTSIFYMALDFFYNNKEKTVAILREINGDSPVSSAEEAGRFQAYCIKNNLECDRPVDILNHINRKIGLEAIDDPTAEYCLATFFLSLAGAKEMKAEGAPLVYGLESTVPLVELANGLFPRKDEPDTIIRYRQGFALRMPVLHMDRDRSFGYLVPHYNKADTQAGIRRGDYLGPLPDVLWRHYSPNTDAIRMLEKDFNESSTAWAENAIPRRDPENTDNVLAIVGPPDEPKPLKGGVLSKIGGIIEGFAGRNRAADTIKNAISNGMDEFESERHTKTRR